MTLVELIRLRSIYSDKGITFISGHNKEEFISYGALYARALKALNYLQVKGLRKGDELVIQVENNQEFLVIFWACLLGGIIPVPLSLAKKDDHKEKFCQVIKILNNPWLVICPYDWEPLAFYASNRYDQVSKKLEDRILYISEALAEEVPGKVDSSVQPQDIAFLQFSSGSTGDPKGVVLTHTNLIANMTAISQAAAYSEKDSMLSWMPLTHDMGMIGFHLNPMFSNINQYLMPTNLFVRHPKLWMEKASEHNISILCSPNFGYRYLLKYLKEEDNAWDLSKIRIIYNGAEPISVTLCQEFNDRLSAYGLKQTAICPVYGLAEASVAVSISGLENEVLSLALNREQLSPGDQVIVNEANNGIKIVNVGSPIDYCSVRIVNMDQEVEEQVIGHIQIKGANVTSEYYNNPVATKAVIKRGGWLDTGDLGFIKDGALYITGRKKDIIFINGQNYYPYDIEKEAESIEGIELNKIAVTACFNDQLDLEEVIAFVFNRGVLSKLVRTAIKLKELINEKFGIDINKVIPVKDIPRTTSGKLQRFKLLEKYRCGDFEEISEEFDKLLTSEYEYSNALPQNQIEKKLQEIWEEVLQTKKVGVERKFFQAGGNSIKAIALIMKMQQEFHVDISIRELYEFSTVRRLAAVIDNFAERQYKSIHQAPKADFYPVTSLQKRLYYASKIDPESIAYNVPMGIILKGKLDVDKLQQSLQNLVLRHDSLRMTFHKAGDGEPVFRVADTAEAKISRTACRREEWSIKLRKLIKPFDLTYGSLFRFYLLEDKKECLLFLDFHHVIMDGQSAYWFINELLTLYSGGELPPTGASYSDFAIWEYDVIKNESQSAYWAKLFSDGIPTLELPLDYPRPAVLTTIGKRKNFVLKKELVERLRHLSQELEVSPHTVYFTLYNVLLSKYSGQKDIVIGIPVLGRRHPDLERTLGMFVNTLAIRNSLTDSITFRDAVRQTFGKLSEAFDHQDLAFDDLINLLDIKAKAGRNPLFDTMFLYQDSGIGVRNIADLEISRFSFDPGFSKFDISMEVTENDEGALFSLEYSSKLFSEDTILRMARSFEQLLQRAVTNPKIKIGNLSPISDREYQQFMVDYNATKRDLNFKAIYELFDEQVEQNPERIAIQFNEQEISYKELGIKVNSAAQTLLNSGVCKGDLVSICLPRSPELVITILGCLRAGAAYVPIDQDMPAERIKFILNDSRSRYIITDSDDKLDFQINVLHVEKLLGNCGPVPQTYVVPQDLAYIIYTSGTTGHPKGVAIEHGSLHNYITWAAEQYLRNDEYTFALYSSISFDLTVTSVFTPLITGNKLVIYENDESEVLIEKVIRCNQADIIKLTPSHLKLLKNNNLLSPEIKIKVLILGGENLETELVQGVYHMMNGELQIYNEYGPTEATVGCMIYKFDPEDQGISVPIGRPIANTQVYLLDEYLKPVPVNVAGELYVAGEGLAREYLYQDQLTTEKFVKNPYDPGKLMYKTGDKARRLSNGNIEYIGRDDQQVKIKGYRVELSEIENQLVRHEDVHRAVVLFDKRTGHITAYYEKSEDESIEDDLKEYLATKLPHYMVPAQFIRVGNMPLTRNGKIDTGLLRQIAPKQLERQRESAQNEVEEILLREWRKLLNLTDIDVKDNFFELGGDSIKAVQISNRLFEQGYHVKVKDILTYHTIKNISRFVKYVKQEQQYEQGPVSGEFEPTPIQNWFLGQQLVNPHYYNQSVLFRVNQSLDILQLQKAFEKLIRHHDTLRINFNQKKRTFFYNENHLETRFTIPEIMVTQSKSIEEACSEIKASFCLSEGLLIKAALICKDGTEYLLITAHHLIMDGISWRILMEDLHRAYMALKNGDTWALPHKTTSYKEWSEYLRQNKGIGKMDQSYWAGIESEKYRLPLDIQTEDWSAKNLRKVTVNLEPDTTNFLLKDAHSAYNTDVPILLNVALVLALNEWTDQTDFFIEMENHGRHLKGPDVSRTLGWFTSIYPVRLEYKNEIDLLIKFVKETLRNVPNNGIGYGMEQFSHADRQHRISEIRFNYLGQFERELDNELLTFNNEQTGAETDPDNDLTVKLELNAMVLSGKFRMEINYNSAAFQAHRICGLADLFTKKLLEVLSYLKDQHDVYFTPSDFEEVNLNEEELKALFE
ncbi:non-ribosomal peptide synthetase [Fulvivirga imtechensis]|nr:non-ribosomal peptide synthetase [Fulvivirga imtechensis]